MQSVVTGQAPITPEAGRLPQEENKIKTEDNTHNEVNRVLRRMCIPQDKYKNVGSTYVCIRYVSYAKPCAVCRRVPMGILPF